MFYIFQADPTGSVPQRLAEKLVSWFEDLSEKLGSEEIEVERFCRYTMERGAGYMDAHGESSIRIGNVASFITALLKTFRVESRRGEKYLSLATLSDLNRREACFRRPLRARLINSTDPRHGRIEVRVTENFRERHFIRIKFYLKQDEAKLH